jgi:hypothetical protein
MDQHDAGADVGDEDENGRAEIQIHDGLQDDWRALWMGHPMAR